MTSKKALFSEFSENKTIKIFGKKTSGDFLKNFEMVRDAPFKKKSPEKRGAI